MAETVTNTTTDFQRTYNTCTTANAERLINRVHPLVIAHLGIGEASEDITLTAGTREYTLTEANIQIRAVYYVKSSANDDYAIMYPVSQDEMDNAGDGFRQRTTRGQPRRYYLASAKSGDNIIKEIGFDPVPDTTSSGGFPTVRIFHVLNSTLATTDELPEQISSNEVYLSGMKWLWARDQRLESEAEYWKKKFDEDLQRETAYYNRLALRLPQRFEYSSWLQGSRMV